MLDRARQFRSSELQDEKMLSLGRMAAGLAHELNNPASAAARSARLLDEALEEGEAAAQALGAARLNDAQLVAVATGAWPARRRPAALAPLARADREDTIVDWLVEHGADANAAASLADTGVAIRRPRYARGDARSRDAEVRASLGRGRLHDTCARRRRRAGGHADPQPRRRHQALHLHGWTPVPGARRRGREPERSLSRCCCTRRARSRWA